MVPQELVVLELEVFHVYSYFQVICEMHLQVDLVDFHCYVPLFNFTHTFSLVVTQFLFFHVLLSILVLLFCDFPVPYGLDDGLYNDAALSLDYLVYDSSHGELNVDGLDMQVDESWGEFTQYAGYGDNAKY